MSNTPSDNLAVLIAGTAAFLDAAKEMRDIRDKSQAWEGTARDQLHEVIKGFVTHLLVLHTMSEVALEHVPEIAIAQCLDDASVLLQQLSPQVTH